MEEEERASVNGRAPQEEGADRTLPLLLESEHGGRRREREEAGDLSLHWRDSPWVRFSLPRQCVPHCAIQGRGVVLSVSLSLSERGKAVPHFRIWSPQQNASGQWDDMQPREVGNLVVQPRKIRWLQRPM